MATPEESEQLGKMYLAGMEALAAFVKRAAAEGATAEEVQALPAAAELLLMHALRWG